MAVQTTTWTTITHSSWQARQNLSTYSWYRVSTHIQWIPSWTLPNLAASQNRPEYSPFSAATFVRFSSSVIYQQHIRCLMVWLLCNLQIQDNPPVRCTTSDSVLLTWWFLYCQVAAVHKLWCDHRDVAWWFTRSFQRPEHLTTRLRIMLMMIRLCVDHIFTIVWHSIRC